LVAITLHKLYRQAKHHRAQRRSAAREELLSQLDGELVALASREPTPEEAAGLADQFEAVLSRLDPFGRRVMELRLQGEPLSEIARETGRSERSVRRALATIRQVLARQYERNDE
jgi:RNA polymerase sigma factor (sigma-70 family)